MENRRTCSLPAGIVVGGRDEIVTLTITCRSPSDAARVRVELAHEVAGSGISILLRQPQSRSAAELMTAGKLRRRG